MSKEYYKEINQWKLKNFFLTILKNEGSRIVSSDFQREELAQLLSSKLVEKIIKETR
jgi:hypothetical protein